MPNAKVLETKKAIVEELTSKIQGATSVVFVNYSGITVAQDTELRSQFREANVEYTVVKNTLTRLATHKAGYAEFDELQSFGELPSKDALIAQVLGTFLAPITSLAFVLDQICQQKGGAPAAEEAAE